MTGRLVTDPTGLCFLSYRRNRASEAGSIIGALRDHGIPTWQDITDLDSTPTEDTLRRVLRDPTLASGILFITPEVADSNIIRKVEAPDLLQRAMAHDAFFAVPVAAGGLSYD